MLRYWLQEQGAGLLRKRVWQNCSSNCAGCMPGGTTEI
nr:hypothetical protein [Alcaligenes sp. HPC1271]